MLALFIVTLMISTQQQVDGISRPTQRSRKMPYGKSRLTFQPFLCKAEKIDASSAGATERSDPSARASKADVTPADSLSSAEDIIKTDMNPIQILEEMNKQRNLRAPTAKASPAFASVQDEKFAQKVSPEPSPMLPAQQQQQQQRSWQKAKTSTGSANIYWRSVDVDDLRTHPYFSR